MRWAYHVIITSWIRMLCHDEIAITIMYSAQTMRQFMGQCTNAPGVIDEFAIVKAHCTDIFVIANGASIGKAIQLLATSFIENAFIGEEKYQAVVITIRLKFWCVQENLVQCFVGPI